IVGEGRCRRVRLFHLQLGVDLREAGLLHPRHRGIGRVALDRSVSPGDEGVEREGADAAGEVAALAAGLDDRLDVFVKRRGGRSCRSARAEREHDGNERAHRVFAPCSTLRPKGKWATCRGVSFLPGMLLVPPSPMKVLGYNGGLDGYPSSFDTGHDAAATLVVDGRVVAACE